MTLLPRYVSCLHIMRTLLSWRACQTDQGDTFSAIPGTAGACLRDAGMHLVPAAHCIRHLEKTHWNTLYAFLFDEESAQLLQYSGGSHLNRFFGPVSWGIRPVWLQPLGFGDEQDFLLEGYIGPGVHRVEHAVGTAKQYVACGDG